MKNRIYIPEAVWAVAFALMTVLSRHTVYSDAVEANILTVYVSPFKAPDIVIFPLTAVAAYLCLQLIKYLFGRIKPYVLVSEDKVSARRGALLWIVVFAIIIICYIPYMMSYWPGGIYNDTCDTIDIALGKSAMSDQNTVLYALFWRFVFAIGQVFDQGDYGGLKLMTVLQCAAIAAVAASFVKWLAGRGIRRWICVMLTVAVALFPIFPYYGISLWKETWFGLELFLYTWMWWALSLRVSAHDTVTESFMRAESKAVSDGDRATKDGSGIDGRMIFIYIMSTTLVIFGRNNGLYMVIFVMAVSMLILRKAVPKKTWMKFGIVNITIVALSIIIRGPVYGAAGIKTPSPAESLGIPLQQTAYMISRSAVSGMADAADHTDTEPSPDENAYLYSVVRDALKLNDRQYDVITSIMPVDAWVNLYNPVVVDSIKFGEFFDREYFEEHTGDFLRTYVGMVFKNPKLAIQGYLLSTMGFWDAYKSSSSAYICTAHTVQAEYFMSDYFNMATDRYLSDIVGPRWYISGGALVWIMLGLLVICMSLRKDDRADATEGVRPGGKADSSRVMSICMFLPGIGLWLTYMLATPLSFSFRYLFGLLLCIPIYVITAVKKAQS